MTHGFKRAFEYSKLETHVFPDPQCGVLPGRSPGRGLLILRCESHPPLCVGLRLVWTFDLLADVIEFGGLFKINFMKSAGKQIEIIQKE